MLTIKDISEQCSLKEQFIRECAKEFSDFLRVKRWKSNAMIFHEDSIHTFRRISELKKEGWWTSSILDKIREEVSIKSNKTSDWTENNQWIEEYKTEIKVLKTELELKDKILQDKDDFILNLKDRLEDYRRLLPSGENTQKQMQTVKNHWNTTSIHIYVLYFLLVVILFLAIFSIIWNSYFSNNPTL